MKKRLPHGAYGYAALSSVPGMVAYYVEFPLAFLLLYAAGTICLVVAVKGYRRRQKDGDSIAPIVLAIYALILFAWGYIAWVLAWALRE